MFRITRKRNRRFATEYRGRNVSLQYKDLGPLTELLHEYRYTFVRRLAQGHHGHHGRSAEREFL